MSRRWKMLAGAFALVVLTATGGAAQADSERNTDGDDDILRFRAVQVEETEIDLGASGFSQGDQIVFGDNLRRDGRRIGTDGGVCTVVRATGDPEFTCVTTFRLPGGTIATQAHFRVSELPRVRLAITGGTGVYDEAEGDGRTMAGDNAPVVLNLDD